MKCRQLQNFSARSAQKWQQKCRLRTFKRFSEKLFLKTIKRKKFAYIEFRNFQSFLFPKIPFVQWPNSWSLPPHFEPWYESEIFGGGDPSKGGGIFPQSSRKNWGISPHFRRRRRREKFLSTFFEIFVKFVNKNAIKSDFWGDCVEVSRKFSKNPRFWQKRLRHQTVY